MKRRFTLLEMLLIVVLALVLAIGFMTIPRPAQDPPELDDFIRYVDEEFKVECYIMVRYEEMSCLRLEE